MEKKTGFRKMALVAITVVSLAGAFAGTARADEWRDHGRHDHDRGRWHHMHEVQYRPYYVVEPRYVPVVYNRVVYVNNDVEPVAPSLPSEINIEIPLKF